MNYFQVSVLFLLNSNIFLFKREKKQTIKAVNSLHIERRDLSLNQDKTSEREREKEKKFINLKNILVKILFLYYIDYYYYIDRLAF